MRLVNPRYRLLCRIFSIRKIVNSCVGLCDDIQDMYRVCRYIVIPRVTSIYSVSRPLASTFEDHVSHRWSQAEGQQQFLTTGHPWCRGVCQGTYLPAVTSTEFAMSCGAVTLIWSQSWMERLMSALKSWTYGRLSHSFRLNLWKENLSWCLISSSGNWLTWVAFQSSEGSSDDSSSLEWWCHTRLR